MEFKHLQSPSNDVEKADTLGINAYSSNHNPDTSETEGEAGHPLYNVEVYGSLRKGGAVNFFSKECIGLIAATFASAFAVECLYSVIQPMMSEHFGYNSAELEAFQRLTSLPTVLCFFFGLLSDSYPILGYRRKGYLIIGLVTAVVSFFILAGMDEYIHSLEKESSKRGLAALIIAFAASASTGILLTYLCVHTRVMELSQREPLGLRGSIQATYLIFRAVSYATADSCIYLISTFSSRQSLSLLICGGVVAFSIPLIWKCWEEKYYSLSTTMRIRGQILWKIMQQKAVWRVLVFTCFYILFLGIMFTGPEAVINTWAGVTGDHFLVQNFQYYGATIVTLVVWRYYFMNRPWRSFYAVSIALLLVPKLIIAICVSQDIIREPNFYRVMIVFMNMSGGMGLLAAVAPLTEIIQEGSEGAMVGLTLSLYFLVEMFVDTNNSGLFESTKFYDIADNDVDTPSARADVLQALVINYSVNALAFLGIFFLPRQKLDTQQLRSYGGYTKCASAAIVAFAATLLLYSLIITAMTFIPATSCLTITGGTGC